MVSVTCNKCFRDFTVNKTWVGTMPVRCPCGHCQFVKILPTRTDPWQGTKAGREDESLSVTWKVAACLFCLFVLALLVGVPLTTIWYLQSKEYKGRTVEEWTTRLDSDTDRSEAFEALSHFGPDAEGAIPKLISLLEANNQSKRINERVRRADAQRYAKEKYPGITNYKGNAEYEKAVSEAEDIVRSNESERILRERIAAAETLGQIGRSAKAAIPALREVAKGTKRSEAELREAAKEALRLIGQ